MTLLGSTEVLDEFVLENKYNVNYNDTALWSYDGYAIRIETTITDEMPVGMCIENWCWSFEPIFKDDYYYFTSFTLALPCR